MALTVVYKGYTIQGQGLPVLESGEWLAEGYAVNLAMKWVDRQG